MAPTEFISNNYILKYLYTMTKWFQSAPETTFP
eukprot:COSAG02_NODE_53779_length_299_cov_1.770000_1_plen_32_part_01